MAMAKRGVAVRVLLGLGASLIATIVAGSVVLGDHARPVVTPHLLSGPASAETSPTAMASASTDGSIALVVELPGGTHTVLRSAGDCGSISNAFLVSWCKAAFGATENSFEELDAASGDWANYHAALAAAILRGDPSICDHAQVQRHTLAPGDRTAVCQASLSQIRSQKWFSVSDPTTGDTVVVSLGSWPTPVE
jgi:hypothetical protein